MFYDYVINPFRSNTHNTLANNATKITEKKCLLFCLVFTTQVMHTQFFSFPETNVYVMRVFLHKSWYHFESGKWKHEPETCFPQNTHTHSRCYTYTYKIEGVNSTRITNVDEKEMENLSTWRVEKDVYINVQVFLCDACIYRMCTKKMTRWRLVYSGIFRQCISICRRCNGVGVVRCHIAFELTRVALFCRDFFCFRTFLSFYTVLNITTPSIITRQCCVI